MILAIWRKLLRPLGVAGIALIALSRAVAETPTDAVSTFVETALALFSPIALLIGFDMIIHRISVQGRRMDARGYVVALAIAGGATAAVSGLSVAVGRLV